jgi:hypothetical protein
MAWLEKVRIKVTAPLDLARLAERDDPIGLLIRTLESLEADQATLKNLAKSVLTELEPKLPAELRGAESTWALDSPEALADALANARERLLSAIAAEDAS